MKKSQFVSSLQFVFIAVLILRLFFAFEWLDSGITKIQSIMTNEKYFSSLQNVFANVWTKDNPYQLVQSFLKDFVAPNATSVVSSIAFFEVFVGICYLIGFLVRPASLIGMGMNAIYFFAAGHTSPSTAGVNLIMFGGQLFFFLVSAGRAYGIDAILSKKLRFL